RPQHHPAVQGCVDNVLLSSILKGHFQLHRLLGTLVSQRLPTKLLPEPDLSQKMSGLLWPKWLPMTELLVGFGPLLLYGSVETTTPPEIRVGPEGTLPERWLPVSSMPLAAPRSAMPIPEKFLPNCAARHERVLSATVLPFTSKPPTGSSLKASKNIPAQLSCTL